MITIADWEKAISYSHYRELVDTLLASGKTTGETQSEKLYEYTRLNVQRMNRWEKTVAILPALQDVLQKVAPQKWLVLTEGWCGDAAQNLPIIAKFADATPQIELRILLRDENLPIMDLYLTNGGRSIPKLIALDSNFQEIFNWGPRPLAADELVKTLKSAETPFEELVEKIHKWYADDKQKHLQEEFMTLLQV